MNSIQEINRINQRELDLGLTGSASWHHQYSQSAYVHVGGLSYEMTEGDVLAVFSQFGEIMDINMPRDQDSGKPKGFAFLMYEDQRSTVLAVDNMNGALVLGRMLKVDHVHKYEQPGKRDEEGKYQKPEEPTYNAMPPELSGSDDSSGSESEAEPNIDAEDPMAAFLRAERRKSKASSKKSGGGDKEEKKMRKDERRKKREERERKRLVKELRAKEKGKSSIKREEGYDAGESRSRRDGEGKRIGDGNGNGERQERTRTRSPKRERSPSPSPRLAPLAGSRRDDGPERGNARSGLGSDHGRSGRDGEEGSKRRDEGDYGRYKDDRRDSGRRDREREISPPPRQDSRYGESRNGGYNGCRRDQYEDGDGRSHDRRREDRPAEYDRRDRR